MDNIRFIPLKGIPLPILEAIEKGLKAAFGLEGEVIPKAADFKRKGNDLCPSCRGRVKSRI